MAASESGSPREAALALHTGRLLSRAAARALSAISLVASDLAALALALTVAVAVRAEVLPAMSPAFARPTYPLAHYVALWWIPVAYLACLAYAGLYTRRDPHWEEARRCLLGATASALVILAVLSAAKINDDMSRPVVVLAWAVLMVVLPLLRLGTKEALVAMGPWRKRAIVLGSCPVADAIVAALSRHKTLGYDVVEVVTDPAALPRRAAALDAREIIITSSGLARPELLTLVESLRDIAENVLIAPDLREAPVLGVEVLGLIEDRALLLRVPNNLLKPWNLAMKRAFDVCAGALLAVACLPVVAAAALAVRLGSPGPAFHVEPRVGRHCTRFTCFKLRTMYVDADRRLEDHLTRHGGAAAEWARFRKLRSWDPRVTPVGRFLRRYGIDEMPQLLNVLRGDMSLVGPRPYLPREMPLIERDGMLDVRPGLTGLWQVSGKNALPFHERVRLDRWYVGNWSLWLDLIVLAKTIPTALRGETPGDHIPATGAFADGDPARHEAGGALTPQRP